MMARFGLCLILTLLCLNANAQKSDFSDTTSSPPDDQFQRERIVPDDKHYPTSFRATVLGQLTVQGAPPRDPRGGASALIEYGRGFITGEVGLAYLTTRTTIAPFDSATTTVNHPYQLVQGYAGVPILLKINYIERPQASVSFKLGIMPAVSLKKTDQLNVGDSGGKTFNLSQNENFAIIGVTGAAPIDERSEFILDLAYTRGLTDLDGNNAKHELIEIGLGVRFDL